MATREDVERVLAHVNRATDLAYFFDQLTSPEWIDALREVGLFDSPPGPEVEGEYIRYPSWAASRYLARVAAQAPDKVLGVLRGLPESGNPRIHEDIAEAATAMPVEAASEIVPFIRDWIDTDRHQILLPERAVELAQRLAEAGAGNQALELAESLFTITIDSDTGFGPKVRTRLQEDDFQESLDKLVMPLVQAVGSSAVRLFVQLLDDALRRRRGGNTEPGSRFDDASTIWRSDVADKSDREARYEPVLNSLVDAVSDGTAMLSGVDMRDALGSLEGAGATIFRRIALQIVAEDIDLPTEEVARLLVDRDAMSDYALELEYLRGLAARADELSLGNRLLLTEWIQSGPIAGAELADRLGDGWEAYLDTWQARRLAALGNAVPPDQREWAVSLVATLDESARLPHRPATIARWVGPASPMPATELSRASIDEIVGYLRAWEPSGEWAAPSREGLGRSLSAAVVERPTEFSKNASAFIGLDPVYVRSLIFGLHDAVKAGGRIRWGPVFDLCDWVVIQETGTRHPDWIREDRDPGWDWTWTEIARLLEQGLTEEPNRIPKAMATRVRRLALILIGHPDPTPEREAKNLDSNMDPSTLSLNTTRGEATHALIRFAWWEKKVLGRAFVEGKVRAALERLVTPATEPSPAVHSAFGRWLGTLIWLDIDWAALLVDRIFPRAPADAAYWWAAWRAFIVFDRPTTAAHRLLREQYVFAIDNLGNDDNGGFFRAGRGHADALAGHLLAYVVWGVEADPDVGMLGALLHGPGVGRAELIEQAGRLLRDHGDELGATSVRALIDLWTQRHAAAQMSLDDNMRQEIARFTWWCGASSLEVRWWLDELLWVVSNGVQLDAPYLALKALPEAVHIDVRAAVRVIDAISRMPHKPWLIQGYRDDVASVLASAIASPEDDARRSAIRLVHDLGAREVADFSDLLPSGDIANR